MIALRATHQAFTIACEAGFEPIDATRVECFNCGAELDWRNNTVGEVIMCVKCGQTTDVPQHLRALVPVRPEPELPSQGMQYLYRAFQFLHEPNYGPVPIALAIFFILCVLSVLGMMAYTLFTLHAR